MLRLLNFVGERAPSQQSAAFEAWRLVKEESRTFVTMHTLRVFVYAVLGLAREWMFLKDKMSFKGPMQNQDTSAMRVDETSLLTERPLG